MLLELRLLSPRRRIPILALRDEYETFIRELIEAAQGKGYLRRDIDARMLTLALLNLLNWTIFWYRPGGRLSPEKIGEALQAVFLEGVLVPISSSRAAAEAPRPPLRAARAFTSQTRPVPAT
jgi:hypothetical protein